MNRVRKFLRGYYAFFNNWGYYAWFWSVGIYALVGAMSAIALGVYVHPLATLIPLIPALILAIREALRRGAVVMSEAFEGSGEKSKEAALEYVEIVKKQKRRC